MNWQFKCKTVDSRYVLVHGFHFMGYTMRVLSFHACAEVDKETFFDEMIYNWCGGG
jgi:hypothetical protein